MKSENSDLLFNDYDYQLLKLAIDSADYPKVLDKDYKKLLKKLQSMRKEEQIRYGR